MNILVNIGDGIGNIIMATPMIQALYDMGHVVDFAGKTSMEGGWKILENCKQLRRVIPPDTKISAKGYDLYIEGIGGHLNRKNIVDIDKRRKIKTAMGFHRHSEIGLNMMNVDKLGYVGKTPKTFCGVKEIDVEPNGLDYIVLHNGHHFNPVWRRKTYPYFAELIKLLSEKLNIGIVIIGSKSDREKEPIEYIKGVADFRGECDILESSLVISKAKVFCGIDGGPAHIASAHGVKNLVMWGATSILKNKPQNAELIRGTECPPCQDYKGDWLSGRWKTCEDWKCIKTDPDKVFNRIKELI